MLIGDKIRYVRRLINMERKDVAERLGVSLSQYSNIENNVSHIDEERLLKFSAIFQMPPDIIKNIDPTKVYAQVNKANEQNTNKDVHIGAQDNEISQRLLIENQKLLDIQDRNMDIIEELVKKLKNHG